MSALLLCFLPPLKAGVFEPEMASRLLDMPRNMDSHRLAFEIDLAPQSTVQLSSSFEMWCGKGVI